MLPSSNTHFPLRKWRIFKEFHQKSRQDHFKKKSTPGQISSRSAPIWFLKKFFRYVFEHIFEALSKYPPTWRREPPDPHTMLKCKFLIFPQGNAFPCRHRAGQRRREHGRSVQHCMGVRGYIACERRSRNKIFILKNLHSTRKTFS